MIGTIRKALLAAGVGLAGAIGTALLDGAITGAEVLAAIGIGLLAGVGVYKIKNADTPPPGLDRGAVTLVDVVCVLVGVFALLWILDFFGVIHPG